MSDLTDLPSSAKYALDGLSTAALLGSIAQLLPHIATLLTVIWMSLRIYESRTIQRWLGKPEAPARSNDDG